MAGWSVGTAVLFGSFVAVVIPLSGQAAALAHGRGGSTHIKAHHHGSATQIGASRHARHTNSTRYAGISCVPFARAESGIVLTGNAATWWDEAEGLYARGSSPEPGSVLNFRANAGMHMGHVAVVHSVVNAREIEIDQANWWSPGIGRGRVSRDVTVVDVSPHNDWTAVRVALGHSGNFGSVYATYGFIYAHGDERRDIRYALSERPLQGTAKQNDEVAEAPADAAAGPLSLEAPDRNLR